jgi:hypothetical protein
VGFYSKRVVQVGNELHEINVELKAVNSNLRNTRAFLGSQLYMHCTCTLGRNKFFISDAVRVPFKLLSPPLGKGAGNYDRYRESLGEVRNTCGVQCSV